MNERVELRQRVLLGGLAQEVVVRGADLGNPLLLILHGGPGFAEMPLFTAYNAELEQHFLVVHWDQRGAGRSYDPDIPAESMTLRQFIADALELIDWLAERFAQEKVYLLGHSWGSLVGAMLASERPARLHAFVGVGQLVAGMRNEQASYAFTLRRAIELQNSEAISALRAIEDRYTGDGGLTFADVVVQRAWLDRFGGVARGDTAALFERVAPELREQYFGERSAIAQEFSFGHLMPDLLEADLARAARTYDIPVHFVIGRHDQNTPAQLAVEYFDAIEAPFKQLHWFEQSAHMMPFEEPAKFNALLTDTVLGRR
ncbi:MULTISPECIES: alpha/beta fold hydrolase [unclassified Kribbella]|uniref:alpha/beta fold hydrolase n=1 Tax=unclassified Kribbella TaxID=2644121 RepID=UPI00301B64B6